MGHFVCECYCVGTEVRFESVAPRTVIAPCREVLAVRLRSLSFVHNNMIGVKTNTMLSIVELRSFDESLQMDAKAIGKEPTESKQA